MMSNKQSRLALFALAVSAFAIGTTEFISVGLLPLIADDLHISVTIAGLTVTLYALGVTIGAPVLTSLTSGMSRKALLAAVMAVFIVGNSLAAVAGSIGVLLAARVVSAFAHGVFMSIGSTIAADLVPENRRASAIAIMFSGLTIATVTGVPLGTFVGQQFGWRVSFASIAVIGVVALIANMTFIPANLHKGATTRLKQLLQPVKNGHLILSYVITALGYGGTFAVFTYLSPLLNKVTGFGEHTVAVILVLYGIAIAIGNTIGGKVANRNPLRALFYMFLAQAAVLAVLTLAAPYKVATLITIFFMGLLAFMNVPGLQSHVVALAERYAPESKDVASALNIAAFNAGIAFGAYSGGLVADNLGLIHTAWFGALIVLIAVVLTGVGRMLERREALSSSRKTKPDILGGTNS